MVILDIGRSIQVPAPAFQQRHRLPKAVLCEIHPDHDRESTIQAAVPMPLLERRRSPPSRTPPSAVPAPATTALASLAASLVRSQSARAAPAVPPLAAPAAPQTDLLWPARPASARRIPTPSRSSCCQAGGVMNDRLQPATRLLQPVPLIPHLRQDDLKVSFQQGIARHLLDQAEGRLALLDRPGATVPPPPPPAPAIA